jgi:hypothetical protein
MGMILLRLGDHFGDGSCWVTVLVGAFLQKKLGVVAEDSFVVLLGFLRVLLGESGFWLWFFCGENVVGCVAKLVEKLHSNAFEK